MGTLGQFVALMISTGFNTLHLLYVLTYTQTNTRFYSFSKINIFCVTLLIYGTHANNFKTGNNCIK